MTIPVPGAELPELLVPVNRTFVVATAIASRDYQDVHHDPELARQRGSRDVFLNILTSNGLAERYVRSWIGSEAVLTRLALRLGVPCHPGDTLRFSGTVTGVRGRQVEVAVDAAHERGVHLTGQVALRLPGSVA